VRGSSARVCFDLDLPREPDQRVRLALPHARVLGYLGLTTQDGTSELLFGGYSLCGDPSRGDGRIEAGISEAPFINVRLESPWGLLTSASTLRVRST